MAYNIDETISQGDPGHLLHHTDLASAVNSLDIRVAAVEGTVAVIHVNNISSVTPGSYPVDTLIIQRTA